MNTERVTATVVGKPEALIVISRLLDASVPYEFTPLANDEYQFAVDVEFKDVVAEEIWTEFTHNGQRWQFGVSELAEWEEDFEGFHFHSYHGLSEPTVETMIQYIDQL